MRSNANLPLRELEALPRSLPAVLLALLHAAVAGEVAGVAKLLVHAGGGTFRGALHGDGDRAEHDLERAGHALADRARLTREAAAVNLDLHIEAVLHLGQQQRAEDG